MENVDYNKISDLIGGHKLLYHYTKFESALKILASRTLLMNPLANMNDINEVEKYFYSHYTSASFDKRMYDELKKYQLLCFCQDGIDWSNNDFFGYNISSMWGHYANNYNGCCLMLEKERLLSKNKNLFLFSGKIAYNGQNHQCIDCNCREDEIPNFVKNNHELFFFKKTEDWSNEQEFRIVSKRNDAKYDRIKIDISDSLIGVIVLDINHDNVRQLKEASGTIPIIELTNTLNIAQLVCDGKMIYPNLNNYKLNI